MVNDDFQCVDEKGIGQGGEFCLDLFGVRQTQDIPQSETHLFGLVIAAEPKLLISIVQTLPEICQNLFGVSAASKLPTEFDSFDEIRNPDG